MFLIYSLLLTGLIYGYVEWRLISLLTCSFNAKIVLSILLFTSIFNLWVVIFLGESCPPVFLKLLSLLQVLLIYLFTATFILDMIRLAHYVPNYVSNIVLVSCICLSIYSVWNASQEPRVKNVELETSFFEKETTPLKIVQLSDLHIGQGFDAKWLQKVIEKTNALNPDVIVITGDLIDKDPEELGETMKLLLDLKSKFGTYIVFGNHEYYHNPSEWMRFYQKINLPVLTNTNTTLMHEGKTIVLSGIDFGARYDQSKADKLLDKIYNKVDDDSLKILLAHHPAVYKKVKERNVFLQLSGHTHGGMIFPVDMIVALSNKGFLRGLYKNKNSNLYVSNGTGLWGGFPARFASFNEITQIIIKGK